MLAENNQDLDLIELSEDELTLVNGGSNADGVIFQKAHSDDKG